MIRVDIETIVMSSGPVPSLIVLRERGDEAAGEGSGNKPRRALTIQTGIYEAASISKGIGGEEAIRPVTHDLFWSAIQALGAKLDRVEIVRVEAPVFYAELVLTRADGEEVRLDSRPSDAVALAVRANAPVFVEDDVMNRAGTIQPQSDDGDTRQDEYEKFDSFVQGLSPNDF